MTRINEYKFVDKITKELLLEIGFTNFLPGVLYYRKTLYGPITLSIQIPIINNNLDFENTKIRVLDEECLQPYLPFYQPKLYKGNDFLEMVILEYNKKMDELVLKGLLENKSVNLENDNSLSSQTIDFRKKYANLINEELLRKWLPNPETGDIPYEPNLEELAVKTTENGYVEKYCLSSDQVKHLRLIRKLKKD